MSKHQVTLTVNGKTQTFDIEARTTLLALLRDELRLGGAKYGCGEGECGACTVLMNGVPVNACLVLAVRADGAEILTVEGLQNGSELHPLQSKFIEKGALQCGYCTPGMLISSYALLAKNQHPNDAQIAEALAGNLCRCTGYQKIYDAVREAADEMFGKGGVTRG